MAALIHAHTKGRSATPATTISSASLAVGGANRVLYALVGCSSAAPADPTSVKWNGTESMTQIGTTISIGANIKIQMYRLVAPSAVSSTVDVTWGASQDERWVVPVQCEDVDQGTLNGTVAQNTGSTTAVSVSASTASGDLTLGFMSWLDVGGAFRTVVSGQTEDENLGGGDISAFEGAGAEHTTAAGASTSMTWTISGAMDGWGAFAFAVNGASPVANVRGTYAKVERRISG